MNNYFQPINMYNHHSRPNLYIPAPNYKINKVPTYNNETECFNNNMNTNPKDTEIHQENTDSKNNHINQTEDYYKNIKEKQSKNKSEEYRNHSSEKPLFELYGIQLYSDDILILLLIFFLYKENVNDMLLLIALFSLLF